jgi:hypothetical protein
MRTIHTFIVKILQDAAHGRFRGVVTSVSSGDQYPFAGKADLLERIERIVASGQGESETLEEPTDQIEGCEPWENTSGGQE